MTDSGRRALGLCLVAALIGTAWRARDARPSEPPRPPCARPVGVGGDVAHPGVVCLAAGEDAAAALRRAGARCAAAGVAPPAPGDRLVVTGAAGRCEVTGGRLPAAALRALRVPVDPNRAAEDELRALPGIGPALARRILEERAARGPFRSVDDLARVRGIGPRTVERLRARLVVDGGGPPRP
ncbi:MAG TPA: ComEA family DNA-binding protein [Polyangia bacterium]|jgi:competence protein ComEA